MNGVLYSTAPGSRVNSPSEMLFTIIFFTRSTDDDRTIHLGSDDCDKNAKDVFCNGPLNSGDEYW